MLDRLIGDWREAAGAEMRLFAVAGAASAAAAATLGLAAAALFVYATARYGVMDACLIVAVVFLALTLALLALYAIMRRRATEARSQARAAHRSLIADPLVVATGLQVVQAIGAKRALTLLAIVGAGLALASRPAARAHRSVTEQPNW